MRKIPGNVLTKNVVESYARHVTSLPWKVELVSGQTRRRKSDLREDRAARIRGIRHGQGSEHQVLPKEKGEEGEQAANYRKGTDRVHRRVHHLPADPLEYVFYGSLEMLAINGVGNGLDPSRLEFVEAGNLFTSEGLEGEGSTTGQVTVAGAEAMQLLTSK